MELHLLEGTASNVAVSDMFTGIKTAVFDNVSFGDIVGVVALIVGATIVMILAWTYGRKAYTAIVNALKGKSKTKL